GDGCAGDGCVGAQGGTAQERFGSDAGRLENDAGRAESDAERLENDAKRAESDAERPENDAGRAESDAGRLENDAVPPSQGDAPAQPEDDAWQHLRRLGDVDRASLAVWGATRLGMVVLAWISAWVFITGPTKPGPWLARWDRWDEGIFLGIAQHGYFAAGSDPRHVAFFPGFPVAVRLAHLFVWNWVAAGLAVSLVAGAVATVALGRLAAEEMERGRRRGVGASLADPASSGSPGSPGSPGRFARTRAAQAAANATFFFALAPAAVFLAAGYSESLFAAFAFSAWLAARRDRWALAVVLAAGASAVRVNGLFLAAAIALEFVLAG
uniref:mannosyltransferase family protein n=1 Tax=Catenulispora pinisilvae TaxID=2705253 RepID=UPI001E5D31A0